MSEKVKVTERIYVDQKVEGSDYTYRVLAHLPGDEITAERAAEIGVTKAGKASKAGKSKAEDDDGGGDGGSEDVQTAEVRSGKPGTTKKAS